MSARKVKADDGVIETVIQDRRGHEIKVVVRAVICRAMFTDPANLTQKTLDET
jgi:hypothetical protein